MLHGYLLLSAITIFIFEEVQAPNNNRRITGAFRCNKIHHRCPDLYFCTRRGLCTSCANICTRYGQPSPGFVCATECPYFFNSSHVSFEVNGTTSQRPVGTHAPSIAEEAVTTIAAAVRTENIPCNCSGISETSNLSGVAPVVLGILLIVAMVSLLVIILIERTKCRERTTQNHGNAQVRGGEENANGLNENDAGREAVHLRQAEHTDRCEELNANRPDENNTDRHQERQADQDQCAHVVPDRQDFQNRQSEQLEVQIEMRQFGKNNHSTQVKGKSSSKEISFCEDTGSDHECERLDPRCRHTYAADPHISSRPVEHEEHTPLLSELSEPLTSKDYYRDDACVRTESSSQQTAATRIGPSIHVHEKAEPECGAENARNQGNVADNTAAPPIKTHAGKTMRDCQHDALPTGQTSKDKYGYTETKEPSSHRVVAANTSTDFDVNNKKPPNARKDTLADNAHTDKKDGSMYGTEDKQEPSSNPVISPNPMGKVDVTEMAKPSFNEKAETDTAHTDKRDGSMYGIEDDRKPSSNPVITPNPMGKVDVTEMAKPSFNEKAETDNAHTDKRDGSMYGIEDDRKPSSNPVITPNPMGKVDVTEMAKPSFNEKAETDNAHTDKKDGSMYGTEDKQEPSSNPVISPNPMGKVDVTEMAKPSFNEKAETEEVSTSRQPVQKTAGRDRDPEKCETSRPVEEPKDVDSISSTSKQSEDSFSFTKGDTN